MSRQYEHAVMQAERRPACTAPSQTAAAGMQRAARQPASGVSGRCVIGTFVAPLKEGVLQLDEPFHLGNAGQCPLPLLACVLTSTLHAIWTSRSAVCPCVWRNMLFASADSACSHRLAFASLNDPSKQSCNHRWRFQWNFYKKNAIAITSVWERA